MSSCPPTLLLLSADQSLAELVAAVLQQPWMLAHCAPEREGSEMFARPNVRLIILDDEAVRTAEQGWLLAQFRRYLPGIPLLYVARSYSEANERQARTHGAHYYVSKPISPQHFQYVLQSFLSSQT